MDVINETTFSYGPLVWQKNQDEFALTVVVKGTFDLCPGAEVALAKEQRFPTGDEFYEGDEEGTGSNRYESDFAYFKPRADVLVVGKAHPPGGNVAPSCTVEMRVGAMEKSLLVVGDRFWDGLTGFAAVSDAVPFSEMELSYENAYGGASDLRNPVGKGKEALVSGAGEKSRPLPNIERPGESGAGGGAAAEPAGFGPVPRTWRQRSSKLGTYDKGWLRERWPGFPVDFDWGYFNAAPADQQIAGYLRGDEELCLTNLHPDHPRYVCRLPGQRVQCFVHQAESSGAGDPAFKALEMNLDTLWVDMAAEQLCLVWRGILPIASDDYRDVHRLMIVAEPLQQAPQPLTHYETLLAEKLAAEEAEFEAELAPAGPQEDVDIDAEIAKVLAEVNQALAAAGAEPMKELPEAGAELTAQEAELLEELGVQLEEPPRVTRDQVVEELAAGVALSGRDLRGLDLSGLDLSGADLSSTRLDQASLRETNLSGADLHDASLGGVDLTGARMSGVNLSGADLTEAVLVSADLGEALLEDAILSRAHLEGAVLDGVQAHYADFREAKLTGASLIRSVCTSADFSGADLQRADFSGANLGEASVEGADGRAARLNGADLTELRASEGADFRGAQMRQTTGPEAIWTDAKLDGADFGFSNMPGADFTGASLRGADFHGVEMSQGRLAKVDLVEATLTSVNLFQGSLERADLTGADLSHSNLYGVEFLSARVAEAVLTGANLKMTKLDGV